MKTLFISYCQRDGNEYADELETQLSDYFEVKRDKSQLIANDDLFDFMAEIANEDYVAIVLTSGYMKSENCMLEVSFLMKQPDWAQKVLVLVIDEQIYSIDTKLELLCYWRDRKEALERKMREEKLGARILDEEHEHLKEINDKLEEFLEGVKKRKNPSQIAIVNEFVRRLKKDALENPMEDTIRHQREKVLEYVTSHTDASREEIAGNLNISYAYALRLLKSLVNQGILQKDTNAVKKRSPCSPAAGQNGQSDEKARATGSGL